MRRNLSFFRVLHNGQKWYVTACEYGPFTSVEAAMAEADRLNAQQAGTRKQENKRAVEYWQSRKIQ